MRRKKNEVWNFLVVCSNELQAQFEDKLNGLNKKYTSRYLTSEQGFTAFVNDQHRFAQIDFCFILVELEWDAMLTRTAFQGFDIGVKLRLQGLKCPFHFFSLFQRNKFYPEEQPPLASLLRVEKYHHLHQIPITVSLDDLLVKEEMTDQLLEDIVASLVSKRGLIREIIHNLKNALININDLEKVKETFSLYFLKILEIIPDKKAEIQLLEKEIWKVVLSENQESRSPNLLKIIDQFSNQLIELTPLEENGEKPDEYSNTRWKVLVVEDEGNVRAQLEDALKRNNIKAVVVDSGEKAFKILEKDIKNEITVLLCDIRLYKNIKTEVWQSYQGYDIIKKINKEFNNLIAYFVLTSARKRLLQLKKDFSFNVTAEYKRDVMGSEGAMNIFLRKLRDRGDEIFFKLRSQPRGHGATAWVKKSLISYKPLGDFYRDHINSIDYVASEEEINETVIQFLTDNSSNKTYPVFRVELKPAPESEQEATKLLDKFRERILVGRRIALGYYIQGFAKEDIYQLMTNKKWKEKSFKFLFNSTFSLSFRNLLANDIEEHKFFKTSILEEELDFLSREFNFKQDFKLVRMNEADGHILASIYENVKSWLEGKDAPTNLIVKNNLEKLLKLNIEKISLNSYQSDFLLAKVVLGYFNQDAQLKEDIEFDLGNIQNKEIKRFLKQLIDDDL